MKFRLAPRISFPERLFLTKHLSTMIKAGIPLAEALDTLIDQNKGPLKKIIIDVAKKIDNGKSLADSLQQYPKVFDNFYISLVRVGEESGTLETNLEFLAKQMSKDYSLRQKVKGAMMYPGLIFSATIIMGSFVALFILPQLVEFFDAFDFPLPLSTKILLGVANVTKDFGLLIMLLMIALIFGFSFLTRLDFFKPIYHRTLLKTPIFGKMLHYNQLARFTRNFGILMQAGLPVNHSLEVTAQTLSNIVFQKNIYILSQDLEKGKNIADIMASEKSKIFPPLVRKMIGIGEKTGHLDDTLLYLANFYEEEIDNISKNLSTTLEPILLLTIGLVVGFVALAIISPIYELTGSIRKG